MNTDQQITLETKLAEHEHSINQLSDEIYNQQRRIDALQKKVDLLIDVIKSRNTDTGMTDTADDRPPHY